MLAYVLRRVLQSVAVLLAVGLVAFTMFRYVGDPVENMLGQEATQADRAELLERLGLNDPIHVQYARFIHNAAVGEFGHCGPISQDHHVAGVSLDQARIMLRVL